MRLTEVLSFYRHIIKVPGLRFEGKHRIHPPITPAMKRKAFNEMMVERRNLEILDNPYLTKAESKGHSKALKKHEKNFQAIIAKKSSKMNPHCYYEVEIKNCLQATKGWMHGH